MNDSTDNSPPAGGFASVWKAAWDTETTGTDVTNDRIITAAFLVAVPGQKPRVFDWLINPGVPIPAESTEVHGIDDAKAQAEGMDPKVALDQIAGHLTTALVRRMPLIAYNQSFDWSILHHELVRHGLPTMYDRIDGDPITLVDPYVLDRQFGERPDGKGQRKLEPTAGRYGVKVTDWHEATADAEAALRIAEAQFGLFPALSLLTPEQLFTAQRRWRAKQAAGTQWWFREKATPEEGGDPNKVIDGSWPLIPAQRGGEAS